MPYAGVSKPPCWLCSVYFESYRTVTGSKIRTQGRRDQPVPPRDVDTAVNEELRQTLCDKLLAKLKTEARVVRAHCRNESPSSQSTIVGSELKA